VQSGEHMGSSVPLEQKETYASERTDPTAPHLCPSVPGSFLARAAHGLIPVPALSPLQHLQALPGSSLLMPRC